MPPEHDQYYQPERIGEVIQRPQQEFDAFFHPFTRGQARSAQDLLERTIIQRSAIPVIEHLPPDGRSPQTKEEVDAVIRAWEISTDWTTIHESHVTIHDEATGEALPFKIELRYIPQQRLDLRRFYVPHMESTNGRRTTFTYAIDYDQILAEKVYKIRAPLALVVTCNQPNVSVGYEIKLPEMDETMRGLYISDADNNVKADGIIYPKELNGDESERLLLLHAVSGTLEEMQMRFVKLSTSEIEAAKDNEED